MDPDVAWGLRVWDRTPVAEAQRPTEAQHINQGQANTNLTERMAVVGGKRAQHGTAQSESISAAMSYHTTWARELWHVHWIRLRG